MSNIIGGMSHILSADSTSSNTSSSSTSSSTDLTSLGKDDFLKLLAVEMENQDPMNPTDNKDSIAQLAQFSALEQMTNVAESMNTLNSNVVSLADQLLFTQGAAMIGKSVSGLESDGTTTASGTAESIKLTDGVPMLQIKQSDGTTVDIPMANLTLIEQQSS